MKSLITRFNFVALSSLPPILWMLSASFSIIIFAMQASPPCLAQSTPNHKYMGVASCSSSNCHGSVSPRNVTNILQNEYTTWSKHDAHAKAWVVLTNQDSQKIGEHLGISQPEKDPLCLACHATYVADAKNVDSKFQIEDGVGCESCHGAAEAYLSSHTEDGSTHEQNLSHGMADLVSAEKRSSLCLSCHYGNEDKTVNHRLIGAGHPRLTFELDTFTAIEPAHWVTDEDYVKRKEAYSPARAWVVGQTQRAIEILDGILSNKRSRAGSGLMQSPELTLLYCFSCHHSLTEDQWKERNYGGMPGELRLNISSIIISAEAAKVLAPELASELESLITNFHAGKEIEATASKAKVSLTSLQQRLSSKLPSRAEVEELLTAVLSYGAGTQFLQFEVAEQIAMAASSLTSEIDERGTIYKKEIDDMYATLANPEAFDPKPFTVSCQALLGRL